MFSENKKQKENPGNQQNKIAAGTIITGDVEAEGCFRIEGTLKGTLRTSGKVVISKGGLIDGNLECENADIEGKFTGKLAITGTLSLKSSAEIEGEVKAAKLAIEPGAVFNATCEMTNNLKPLKDSKKLKKQELTA